MSKYLDPDFDDDLILDEQTVEGTAEEEVQVVDPKQLNILQLIERIVNRVEDSELKKSALDEVKGETEELASRLDITPIQAVWMAVLANMADDFNIQINDLAHFLRCKSVRVQTYWSDIMALAYKRLIYVSMKTGERVRIVVSTKTMAAFRANEPFKPENIDSLEIDEWLSRLQELLQERESGITDYTLFTMELGRLLRANEHLEIVKTIEKYGLDEDSRIVLLRTVNNLIQDNDDMITSQDIRNLLESGGDARRIARQISNGDHELVLCGLIELQNEDGRANPHIWHLSDKGVQELLSETDFKSQSTPVGGLMKAESIQAKKLYFNDRIGSDIDQLRSLLGQERFSTVQKRLLEQGMRRGVTCLFYGGPGTGKTESVYQLARETGRDILPVDIPSLRSKWVGETEKNIKAVFDRYRALVKHCEVAPILLFNECDAILNKRKENATRSVDKMENAMQNIILQEMETLDGIMIATTNLTGNLDDAFERRFLYKVEFTKPSANESKHIWQTMLPCLSDEDAFTLATKYEFSGGQIENIARKQIVSSILFGDGTNSFEQILKACNAETIHRPKTRQPIGF